MDKQNVQAIYPLTETQEGFYFYGLRETDDPGAIQVRFSLQGSIDRRDLQAAWTRVVDRHEALRMSVQSPGGRKPMLVVAKRVDARIVWLDGSTGNEPTSGLALADVPAHRLTVRILPGELHECVWDCHHLLLDGWSATVVLRDFVSLYAQQRGAAVDLPFASPYADYLRWKGQRSHDETNAYWSEYLDGCQASGSRSITQGMRDGGEGSITLPPPFALQVQQCATRYQVTPAAIAQSAWALVLAAMSASRGEDDVTFGCSTAGRSFDLPGRDHMVGLFANIIPRRVSMATDGLLSAVLQRMHQQNFESAQHEYCGLPQIERHYTGDGALIDSLLVFENLPSTELQADIDDGVRLVNYSAGLTTAFPLTMVVAPGDEWTVRWLCDGTRFDATEAQRAAEFFVDLLNGLVESSDVPLHRFLEPFVSRPPILHEPTREEAANTPPAELAATATEVQIAAIWEELLGVTEIDVGTDFQQLGGRSLMAVRMIAMIEARTGRQISMRDLVANPTIRGLAAIVDSNTNQEAKWRSLVPIKTRGNKPPLICVHAGGAHVLFFRELAKHMGHDQPLFAFQPIGLDGECEPMRSFEELAALYVSELRTLQPDGPYYLSGHCFGAKVAFEMARQLLADGQSIAMFVAIDTSPPKFKDRVYETPANRRKKQTIDLLSKGRLFKFGYRFGRSVILNTIASWRQLQAKRELTRIAESRSVEQKRLHKVQQACIVGLENYRAEKLPIEITLIRSRDTRREHDEWQALTDSFREVSVPIGHFSMFSEPEVGRLAEALQSLMDSAAAQVNLAISRNSLLESSSSS